MSKRKKCSICKKLFIQNRLNQKYCSISCASRAERKIKTFTCVECGDEFKAKSSKAKFCSKTCKGIYNYRVQKKEPKPIDPKWLRGPTWDQTANRRMGSSMEGSEI